MKRRYLIFLAVFLAAVLPSILAAKQVDARKAASLPHSIINPKDGSELILIPAGAFIMGSPYGEGSSGEHPRHRVYLSAYYIGKYEVTNGQFAKFVNDQKSGYRVQGNWKDYYTSGRKNHPVVGVTWKDAQAYCRWANLRLPTEAEWEKAARGTDGRKYPWGNKWEPGYLNWVGEGDIKLNSWIEEGRIPSKLPTEPVGSYKRGASPYGCLDMAGNVWEWCSDWYGEKYYGNSPSSNPPGRGSGKNKVLRGSSWGSGLPDLWRCAVRLKANPDVGYDGTGIRLVCPCKTDPGGAK